MKKIIALLLIVVMTVNGVNDCFALGPDDVENPISHGITTEITDSIEPDDHKDTFWDKAKRGIQCVGGLALFAGLIIGGVYIAGLLRADGYKHDDALELPQEQNNINTLEDYKPTIIPVDKIEHPDLFMDKIHNQNSVEPVIEPEDDIADSIDGKIDNIQEQNSVEPIIEPEDDIADSIEGKKENTQKRKQLATYHGTCGTGLNWTLDTTSGVLTISGSGSMTNYTSSSIAPWHSYKSSITSVTIGNGVTSIGNLAFSYCRGLTSITIPSSVKSIGDKAFWGCSSLTSVTIGDGVTSIGNSAFFGCSSLTQVTIPTSVTTIGICAFCWCSGLTQVTIPTSVTSIGEQAFYDCSGLTSVTIEDGVTSIGDLAFYDCSGLTSVTYEGTSDPGASSTNVFYGCSKLTEVNVPCNYEDDTFCGKNIKRDGVVNGTCGTNVNWEFVSCTGVLTISGSGAMENYTSNSNAPWYSYKSSITSVTIEDGVTSIGNYAFYQCSKLTSITIPSSVTSIGNDAFRDCSSLTSITIPDSVKSIGYWAFYDCSGLTSVTIGNGVTSIGEGAFRACSGLTSVTIGNGVTSIGFGAFYDCSGLTSITIPDSVTSIGDGAFRYCSGLTSVTYRGVSEPTYGTDVFKNCNALKVVKVPLAYNGSYFCNMPVQKPPRTKSRDDILPKNSRTRVFLGIWECPK